MSKEKTTNENLTKNTPARRTMWEKVIAPNKQAIIKLVEDGASERQIASSLGISWSCWLEQKKKHNEELEEMLDRPRAVLVGKLKSALISRALGYAYEESVTEVKQDIDVNGRPVGRQYVYKRTIKQFAPPDTTAIFACLKIYDKDNIQYDDKAQMIDIKRKELEMRQKEAGTDEDEQSLVEKIKNFKIEIVDASRKEEGENYDNQGN